MAATREQGLAALKRGDFDAAISYLEGVQAEAPVDCQTLLYLAGAYHQTKRDDDAVRVLSQVVQLQPENARAYYNLGVSLERLHRYEEARAALRRALTLKPDYALAAGVLAKWEQADTSSSSILAPPIPAPCVVEPAAESPSPITGTAIPDSAPGEAVADAPVRRTRRTSKARRTNRLEAEASVDSGAMPAADAPPAPLEADPSVGSGVNVENAPATTRNDASSLPPCPPQAEGPSSPPCDSLAIPDDLVPPPDDKASHLDFALPVDTGAPDDLASPPDDLAPLLSEGAGSESAALSEAEPSNTEPTRRWRIFRKKPQPADQEAPEDLALLEASRKSESLETSQDLMPDIEDLWRMHCPEAREALRLATASLVIVGFGFFFGPMAISRAISAKSRIAGTSNANGDNVANAAIVLAAVGIVLSVIEWSCLFIWAARS